ncbi:MAG: hypothetical protein IJP38_05820, partial [Oscillospiraceae bacterium]|nr:hypothetical protein [Oscillospiraceae bacterium]
NLVEVPLLARFALSRKSFAFPWTSPQSHKTGFVGALLKGFFKGVDASKKYAGGIFLAIDRSGYAARNSVI